jgi:AraC-like DNA-binding protein
MELYREITPLTQNECFTIFSRHKNKFDFPLHYHDEFELNFIENAKGAKRIIGDHIEEIDDLELVLVGSNVPHGWFNHECKSENIFEITIQFHKDLFDEKFLKRNQLSFIRTILERSPRGILFSRETTLAIKPRLIALSQRSGFESILELMAILHTLSVSSHTRMLSNPSFVSEKYTYNSRRIEKAFTYIHQNYKVNISLADIAKEISMSEISCSRFIKKRTGRTFTEILNDIRMGYASRLLIDTTFSIAEVSFQCGFNNLSYFNRVFRRKHKCTPVEFRKNYSGTKLFI